MKKTSTRNFVVLALLVAILLILAHLNIPMPAGLSITFNMIPLAIAAIVVGPGGGAFIGLAFGLISFLQCFGIFGASAQGMALIELGVSPVLLFLQRVGPRVLDGFLLGFLYRFFAKKTNVYAGCSITGFLAAFLNTAFFMSTLAILFGRTEVIQSSMAGRGFFAWVIGSVGVNGVVEMIVSTILTGAIGSALYKAGFFREAQ